MKNLIFVSVLLVSYTYSQSPKPTNQYFMFNKQKFYLEVAQDLVAVKFKNVYLQKRAKGLLNRHKALKKVKKNIGRKVTLFSLKDKNITESNFKSILKSLNKNPEVLMSKEVVYPKGYKNPMVLTDDIIIRFRPEVTKNDIDKILAKFNLKIKSQSNVRLGRIIASRDEKNKLNVFDISNSIYYSGLVEYCHPDFMVETIYRTYTPNDPLFPDQWNLNNTGQGNGTVDADVDAPEAWEITRGSNEVRIAVIDDAIDHEHPDLTGNVVSARDEENDDDDPAPDNSSQAHGTCVAGIAVAVGNNNEGISGMCPECSLIPIKATDGTFADQADAFDYAVSVNADIITNSWGYDIGIPATDDVVDAINNAAINGRNGKGAVIFFAMTNTNVDNCVQPTPDISSLDNVIAISRSTNLDEMDFAGFGNCMDLLAPTRADATGGTLGITTTDVEGHWGYSNGDYTHNFGGTSAATPLAAGIGGLILSIIPGLDRQQVQRIMETTADKIQPNTANYNDDGFSSTHGHGRVNALKATRLATWYGVMNPILSLLN